MSEQRSLHQRWLALNDHRLRLLDTWCALQRRLELSAGWFALTDAERAQVELAEGLTYLDLTLRLIDRRLRRWLRTISRKPEFDLAAVTANLEIAKRLLPAEENRIAHGLIARAVRDLARMQDLE